MACCVLTAYFMNKIIESLELFDIRLIDVKYNDFDEPLTAAAVEMRRAIATLAIDGMTCAACSSAIGDAVKGLQGVHSIKVSLPLGEAVVMYDSSEVGVSEIQQTISATGYRAKSSLRSPEARADYLEHNEELFKLRSCIKQATVLVSVIATIETTCNLVSGFELLPHMSTILGLWVILGNAAFIHKCAWRNLKAGHLTMDTLTSLSLLLSVCMTFGYFHLSGISRARGYASSGAYLATVILCGRYIDLILRRKSAANFSGLYRLQNETEKVFSVTRGGTLPAMLLRPQDEVVLEAQTVIPVDCYLLQGTALVDQSVMTGESRPVSKTIGDRLLAGTKNLSGTLKAIVINTQDDSSLQKVVDSVTSSLEAATEAESAISSITRYFVGLVLLLTVFSAYWTYAAYDPREMSRTQLIEKVCERVMAVLASACPCALGLAGPMAMMAGIDVAWRAGIMVTNSVRTFTDLTRLTHIVMDKTGTLTEGELQVTSIQCTEVNDLGEAEIYMMLCAVERASMQDHPIASTIFAFALKHLNVHMRLEQNKIETRSCTIRNNGVACEIKLPGMSNWRSIACGNSGFVSKYIDEAIEKPLRTTAESTQVFVCIDRRLTVQITLQDVIRKEAPHVISKLKKQGLQISMLTGDVDEEAGRVCSELNIPLLAAAALEKKQHIEALQRKGHVVAMVGDGFNDLTAQAQADVGVHLKLPGSTSISASAAQVLLSSPDLSLLPTLIAIAQMTTQQSRINLTWTLVYNAVAIGLASGLGERWGLSVNAAMAGSVMAFSSTTVTAMSLHLRYRLENLLVK